MLDAIYIGTAVFFFAAFALYLGALILITKPLGLYLSRVSDANGRT